MRLCKKCSVRFNKHNKVREKVVWVQDEESDLAVYIWGVIFNMIKETPIDVSL